ncbi:MAG: hypothetical protein P1R58_00440 [bacterium]|nr:hypothetical protein [bacterium]
MRKSGLISLVLAVLISMSASAFEPVSLRQLGFNEGPQSSTGLSLTALESDSAGRTPTFSVTSGYLRQFELSELDSRFLFVSARLGRQLVALGLSQLGDPDYYADQQMQLGVGRKLKQFQLALNLSFSRQSFGARYSSLSATSWGLSARWETNRFSVAIVGDNLSNPSFQTGSVSVERSAALYVGLLTTDESRIWLRQEIQQGFPPRFQLTQLLRLNRSGTIFWDFSSNPSAYGGGLRLLFKGYRFNYAASHHPVLGLSHGLSIGYTVP